MFQSPIWAGRLTRQSTKRRKKHQFRHGERKAVLRAVTGASLLLGLPVKPTNQIRAAELVGANLPYLKYAVVVLESEDATLLHDVISGRKSLRAAAAEVCNRAKLVASYRKSSRLDHATAGNTIGVSEVWDELILPNL